MKNRQLAPKKSTSEAQSSSFPLFYNAMNRWFDDFLFSREFPLMPEMKADWVPKLDIKETEKEIAVSASVPGVDKKDIKVELKENLLTIEGERKTRSEEKTKNYIRREQSYGSFYRSIRLPDNIKGEAIKAVYKDGVLDINIPKNKESHIQSKKITVL